MLHEYWLIHLTWSFPEKLLVGSQCNFTCILMGSMRIAVQNIIDLTDDLDLSRSQLCKMTYLGSCWTNRHQILTLGSFDWGISKHKKTSRAIWTFDVRERVTFATIKQKDVFHLNLRTKALRMTILASRYIFSRSRNLMVPFVLTYDLHLSTSWPLQNHVLGHISVINGQNVAKF